MFDYYFSIPRCAWYSKDPGFFFSTALSSNLTLVTRKISNDTCFSAEYEQKTRNIQVLVKEILQNIRDLDTKDNLSIVSNLDSSVLSGEDVLPLYKKSGVSGGHAIVNIVLASN